MDIIKSQNREEINVHRQIWGENTEATIIQSGRRRQEMSIL